MRITRKENVEKPYTTRSGERVYEMIGLPEELGGATKHSLGYVVIPPEGSSRPHYHPSSEETYYIMRGKGKMLIDDVKYDVGPGDTILISPSEKHQIFCIGSDDLEFIVVCAPPWEPNNSVYLDEQQTKD